jgi:hypothetical protein
MPTQEVAMSPKPTTDNTSSEGFIVPLNEFQYAVLFYCLDILRDSQDVMLSPDMATDVREIRLRLGLNLLHEDESKLEWAERLAADYLRYWDVRNPLSRLQKKARFEVYEKVVTSYQELLKEIEECSKSNDWQRTRQAVADRMDWASRSTSAAAISW